MRTYRILPQLAELGARAAGTSASDQACEFVREALAATGVEVTTKPFSLVSYEPDIPELTIDGAYWAAGPCMYSQPTPPSGVEGRVEFLGVDNFLPGLFEPYVFSILGEDGAELARLYGNPIGGGGAGAFAASIGPTLTGPAAYISNTDALRLLESDGGTRAHLVSGGRLHPGRIQRNVLGLLPGDDTRTAVVSAHYDSAWGSTGAIDNATGVEGVLQLAAELAARDARPFTFLFALFAAEEAALSGARAFVNRARIRGDLDNLAGIVNLDCIGAGTTLTVLVGPEHLAASVEHAIGRLGLRERYEVRLLPPGPGADHFPFVSAGVPGLTISYFPFPDYHLSTDNASLFDAQRLDDALDLARVIIEELTGGLP